MGAYIHDTTLLILPTVYVRSRDPKRLHDCPLESSYALLPLAHHTSTVATNRLLCAGRALWDMDDRDNGSDRNEMRQSHSLGPVRQDLSQIRESPIQSTS